ncbi:MAG TPA: methylmalonyl-CoA mutase family protein [Syntrophales bacterium]|nr:methylmalonyl-CoA mutase family protein [Syntrophales bacterium]HOX94517.1 methylmalonyl-CoA mutase family protein [Syntrophales bacterium]HPI57512.1 methylmalonyl-CoA mutase family protein [Syntrophales bacterium]HPN24669.1 methylmalonyl-CoA mutase family protein [Syntrophales bacterium]HQM29800.1 methylmalonyl-CoA mutase family protein [Syntrophales bacterium]
MKRGLFNKLSLRGVTGQRKRWSDCLSERGEDKAEAKTLSGIPVKPIYAPDDLPGFDYGERLGFPGEEPFTRGVYRTMYRGRTWTQRQLAGFGPPEETNQRYKFLLAQGATGINGVFDYPTLRGYDSTDPEARADVGRGGVAIDTLEDMRILFEGIPVDCVSTSLVTCQPICNIIVQSMYFANAQARGIPFDRLAGTSQNDFLMETAIAIAPGVLPPEVSFKLSCDAIEYCSRHVPRWNPVSFAGYNYREAGCTAVQEAAFTIANAVACAEELIRRGFGVDRFAPRLSFFFSAHNDFFEEVCKYRAARRLWARVMKERFGAKNARSMMLRFHVQTAGVSLTAQQPLNNVTRAAYQALSAVLGGAQSIHVDAYDEALCVPTELSSLTALRTQQILQSETGVTATIDPLGGSYFVEALTDELEKAMTGVLDEIDRMGGIVEAVKQGWIHQEISNAAYDYQRRIESGEQVVVGINAFRIEDEKLPIELFKLPETLRVQELKLEKIKKERSAEAVRKVLGRVAVACDRGENLMDVMLEAVKAFATEGELAGVLKKQYGVWNPPLFT